MNRAWLQRAGAAVLLAVLLIGACAGVAAWGVEQAVIRSERASRRSDVEAALRATRDLLAQRLLDADREAARLASSSAIQSAYISRDAAQLRKAARGHDSVGFVLWNGRVIGTRPLPGLSASFAVIGASGFLGRVVVGAAPTQSDFAEVRRDHPDTHLAFAVAGRVVVASPPRDQSTIRAQSLFSGSISVSLGLNKNARRPARLYAFRPAPSIQRQWLWPWLFAAAASALALAAFNRREEKRHNDAPPSTVREAVALVGETLAATHNPDALLPVILRAAVEATDAAGGMIMSSGKIVASQATTYVRAGSAIEIPLEIAEGEPPATMTLFPPAGGFTAEARDAANWISDQAAIALENARLHRLVERQAITDELTGLPNRRQFLARLDIELSRSRRSGRPLALVLADLDDFKRVNDTWGHGVGDQALRNFAAILRSTVREIDLPARLGGEEFAILLPDTDLAGGIELAERARHLLAASSHGTTAPSTRLTASFGVTCFPTVSAPDELLVDADKSLYEAKRRGKNVVVAAGVADTEDGGSYAVS